MSFSLWTLACNGILPNKNPDRQFTPFRAGCFYAIQGRPGAQVALLQSLVSLTVLSAEHTRAKNARNIQTTTTKPEDRETLRADMR